MSGSENNNSKKPLKEAVFDRIETEKVCPHSRLFFRGRECLVWSLWIVSVFVGAFAIAVSIFVVVHHQYAMYEATHENFITFIIEALPYLWIATFGLMVYAAVYNLRHTKHGYRYPLWMIMASSVVLSFAGGSILQLFDFGYEIDEMFGRHMVGYISQNKYEEQLWQNPSEGRLVGTQIYTTLTPTTTVIFEDRAGDRWVMDITELSPRDVSALFSGNTVKLLGVAMNETPKLFHACGAFPWVRERDMTVAELTEQREEFVERVHDHARRAETERFVLLVSGLASTTPLTHSVCATIAPVRKMPIPPVPSDR